MPRYLIAESELPDQREQRRARAGKSSGETYVATLKQMRPDAQCSLIAAADEDAPQLSPDQLATFDAVLLTGSPMHVYEDGPAVRRQLDFMRAVFASGTPSFGSCAGLQVATAAAGGRVRRMPGRMEAGIVRGISATEAGRGHPLLAGRPACWDAIGLHGDEVEELPPGATLLAGNAATTIQAAEIRHDRGVFWGVQYHPELALAEVATALQSQAADLVEAGLAGSEADVSTIAHALDGLHHDPDSRPLRWKLGVDREVAEERRRRTEITNFLDHAPGLKRSRA
ncbi:type 1 glutamine amidotransferase [Croceibacterium ferulae]|uniref:type 1 glutamine amidotransferase n=1 Tax=Croceibacterium ferulae TaxID=1854641 RepID=UPI000EADCDC9|nr:type 1 glutamine amidotransferase [Croceibacterium ferulae]